MKKLLVVGNIRSIHIYNYIKNVIADSLLEVTLLDTSFLVSDSDDEYILYYKSCGIKVISKTGLRDSTKITTFNQMKELRILFDSLKEFDYLHIHYVSYLLCWALINNRKKFNKIIISFWGSDLYRDTTHLLKKICVRQIINLSDSISLITSNMQDVLLSKFHVSSKKALCVLDFGNMMFEDIDKLKYESEGKPSIPYETLGIKRGKITVAVGSAGRLAMRQLETVLSLQNCGQVLDNCQLIIPAYGMDNKTKSDIITTLEANHVEYKLFDYFMNPKETVALRVVTDLFIHPQTTDALSNAMLEHFYAGTVVLNGSWLEYPVLEDNGVYYKTFQNFMDLPSVFSEIISNIESEKYYSIGNKQIISQLCSWDNWRDKWLKLYN